MWFLKESCVGSCLLHDVLVHAGQGGCFCLWWPVFKNRSQEKTFTEGDIVKAVQ